MTLKIKDKKIILTKLYFFLNFMTRKFVMDKGSGSGIFPDPDPGDRKKHRIRIRNTEQNTTVGMCVVLWNLLCHNTF